MSASNLTSLASKYFAGVPVSPSSQGVSGDSYDFISGLFPDKILNPKQESDGSVSYYDKEGNLLAVVDDEGNVFANIDGEIVIYEVASKTDEEAADVAEEEDPSRPSGVCMDPKAMVCEDVEDTYSPEDEQCLLPEYDDSRSTGVVAKNLFGSIGDFVGYLMESDEAGEGEGKSDEGLIDRLGEMVDGVVDTAKDIAEKVMDAAEEYAASKKQNDAEKKGVSQKTPVDGSATKEAAGDFEDYLAVEEEDSGGTVAITTDDPEVAGAPDGDAGASTSDDAAAGKPEETAGVGGYEVADPVYPRFEAGPEIDYRGFMMRELSGAGVKACASGLSSTTGGVPSVLSVGVGAFDPIVAGAVRAVGGLQSGAEGEDKRVSNGGGAAGSSMATDDKARKDLAGSKVAVADRENVDNPKAVDPASRSKTSSGSSHAERVMRSSLRGLGILAGGAVADEDPSAIADITAKFGGIPPTHVTRMSTASFALALNGDLNLKIAVKEPTHQGDPSDHNEGENRDDGEKDQGRDGDDDDGERAVNFA